MSVNKPYNAKLIGPLLDVGADHMIKRYGNDRVIKFPVGLRYRLSPKQWLKNMQRDSRVLRKYFGTYLTPAVLMPYVNGSVHSYVIIEPFYQGRHLRKSDLKNLRIKKQFSEIVKRNKQMIDKEHLSLDFFGIKGLLWKGKQEVCNIMLEDRTKRLRIIDVAALHFGKTKDRQTIVSALTNLGLKVQKRLLSRLLAK